MSLGRCSRSGLTEEALKELAGDESLSEEARDAAMKALEAIAVSELAEIEQAAAMKKLESDRNLALKKLEFELTEMESGQKKRAAELMDTESQQSASLKKLESEAQFIDEQSLKEQKKAEAEAEAEMLQKLQEESSRGWQRWWSGSSATGCPAMQRPSPGRLGCAPRALLRPSIDSYRQ